MGDTTNFREERIEKLLDELRYEVTRGMMEGDIEEEIGFEFIIPVSKSIPNGVVNCRFQTRPMPHVYAHLEEAPRLKVVK